MSTRTTNLNLHLWSEDDYVLMEEFNDDHQAIDNHVNTARAELETVRRQLIAAQQRANRNLFHLIGPGYFTGRTDWPVEGMVLNRLDSAEETGTCIGFSWSSHPIRLGQYSVSVTEPSTNIYDAGLQKSLQLPRSYRHAMLLVQAEGWYSQTPPLSDLEHHVEDYTGITLSASLNDVAMTSRGWDAASYPLDSPVSLREYIFELEGDFSGTTTVRVNFHCPDNRGLWVYDWALLLA